MRTFHRPTTLLLALALMAGPTAIATAQSGSPDLGPAQEFTGQIAFGDCPTQTSEVVDGVTRTTDECIPQMLQMSDARLDGAVTVSSRIHKYPDGLELIAYALRIENDGGAWQQQPVLAFMSPDGTFSTVTISLVGEGGYEGLTAVAEALVANDMWTLDGFIIEGEVPPAV